MGWLKKGRPAKIEEPEVSKPETNEAESKPVEKSEEAYDEIIVVKELPTVQMRFAKLKDGKTAKLITTEEALTEIMNGAD
jgi:hypothetical protein